MNKVLLWSIIAVAIIVLLIVILGPNMVGSLRMEKSASDNATERWMYSEKPKASTGGDLVWLDTVPVEESKSEPMMDANKQNDVSGTETPDDKEPLQTNKKHKRQMIYTADYRIHVKDFEVGISTAKSLLADYQGYVNLQTNSRLVVRVPAEYFDDFTKAIERIGKVITRNIKAVEVTTQYYDLKRRIEVLEASIEAWEKKRLLVKTDEAIIKIDQIIDDKVSQVEIYKGQLRVLSDQISRSTITIDFTMDPTPEPAPPRHKYHVPYNWIRSLNPERLLPDYSYVDEDE